MPCRPAHPRSSTRSALLLLAALAGGVNCTSSSGDEDGTPLPEPPDGLPRPSWNSPEGIKPANDLVAQLGLFSVALGGDQIIVKPNTEVWAINLDQPSVPPAIITSNAQGRFPLAISAASNDRIRILSRTETEHSPPLDLAVVVNPMDTPPAFVVPLTRAPLSCLGLRPIETVELSGTTGTFTLDNRCPMPLAITKAALRFGDRGITLGEIPGLIAPDEQVTLTFEDIMGPGPIERLDILLLEIDAGDPLPRKYAIDLFTDVE